MSKTLSKIKRLYFKHAARPKYPFDYAGVRNPHTPVGVFGDRNRRKRQWNYGAQVFDTTINMQSAVKLGQPLSKVWGKGGDGAWVEQVRDWVRPRLQYPVWWLGGLQPLYGPMTTACSQCQASILTYLPHNGSAYGPSRAPYAIHITCSALCAERWKARVLLKGVGLYEAEYVCHTLPHQNLDIPQGMLGISMIQPVPPEEIGL